MNQGEEELATNVISQEEEEEKTPIQEIPDPDKDGEKWHRLLNQKGVLLAQDEALRIKQERIVELIKTAQAINQSNNAKWGVKEKVLFEELFTELRKAPDIVQEAISKNDSAHKGLAFYADHLPHKGVALDFIKAFNAKDKVTFDEAKAAIKETEEKNTPNQDIEKVCEMIISEVDKTLVMLDELILKVETWIEETQKKEEAIKVTGGATLDSATNNVSQEELASMLLSDDKTERHGLGADGSLGEEKNEVSLDDLNDLLLKKSLKR